MVFVDGRNLTEGTKVFIYFNLHKKCFSIKALEGEFKNKVVAHADSVCLKNAKFHVSEKGRERVLREQRKNVHAGVVGRFFNHISSPRIGDEVLYDPYKFSTFVYQKSHNPIHKSDYVLLENKRVYV